MDTETKEKLTEQQHQIEMLRTDMEANMRTMKAENESAIDRLQYFFFILQLLTDKSIRVILGAELDGNASGRR